MTWLGSATDSRRAVSAPVPQPTSSHRPAGGTASQLRNSIATRRLQRPTYDSYASLTAHTSRIHRGSPARWSSASGLLALVRGQWALLRGLRLGRPLLGARSAQSSA